MGELTVSVTRRAPTVVVSTRPVAIATATAIGPVGPAGATVVGPTGPQGPVGAQGPVGPAGSDLIVRTASVALGGGRVVRDVDGAAVTYADNIDLAMLDAVLGITAGAASAGQPCSIRTAGDMTDPAWNWTADQPLWVGTNGLLTQTPPDGAAVIQIVATAVTATTIRIRFLDPILA